MCAVSGGGIDLVHHIERASDLVEAPQDVAITNITGKISIEASDEKKLN